MDKNFEILQNQFHEITISLNRVDQIQCDKNWRGNGSRPPYSSIGLIRKGTGTIIVNGQEMQPVKDQLYLLPAYSTQTFFNDGTHPYLKYFSHFNIKLHDVELFDIIQTPFCVNPENPEEVAMLFEKMIRSIAEISASLGFSSQFYFCSFFKKQTGMTPTEYRRVYCGQ